MQDQQFGARTRRERVSAALIVAELDQRGLAVKLFDQSADLPAFEPLSGAVAQQGSTSNSDGPSVFVCFPAFIIAPSM